MQASAVSAVRQPALWDTMCSVIGPRAFEDLGLAARRRAGWSLPAWRRPEVRSPFGVYRGRARERLARVVYTGYPGLSWLAFSFKLSAVVVCTTFAVVTLAVMGMLRTYMPFLYSLSLSSPPVQVMCDDPSMPTEGSGEHLPPGPVTGAVSRLGRSMGQRQE